jgi:hypothetical protein
MILYGFYKLQLKHSKGLRIFCEKTPGKFLMLTIMPLVCTKHPEELRPCNAVLGAMGWRGW